MAPHSLPLAPPASASRVHVHVHVPLLFLVGLCASATFAVHGGPVCKDHSDLTVYPTADGKCDTPVQTPADWAIRRADIIKGFEAVAGTLPPCATCEGANMTALDMKIINTTILPGGVRRVNLTYVSHPDDQMPVPAFLYVPPAAYVFGQPMPCVLSSHPTSVKGKDYASIRSPQLNYAAELASRGFVVIAPDYPSMGGLSDYDFAKAQEAGFASGTIKAVYDNMRAIDLLSTLDYADTTKLAAIGHSLGGHNSLFTAVMDTRIKVVVSSSGWTPWDYYTANPLNASWSMPKYMPRIESVYHNKKAAIPFDFYELVAALAPRAFFSNSPYTDPNFNVSGVWAALPKVRPVWDLHGVAEALETVFPPGGCMFEPVNGVGYHDCGHDFPPGTRWEAYDFMERHLGRMPGGMYPGSGYH